MKTTQKIIHIKRSININNDLKKFIFHNINLRRHIWNLFVEESKKYDNILDFDIVKYATKINDSLIEQIKYTRDTGGDTSLYCTDIVKSVYNDVKTAIKAVIRNGKERREHHELRFKSFDRFKGSFRVPARNILWNEHSYQGKVHFKDEYNFEFRASYKHVNNKYNINLREAICDLYDSKTNSFWYYDKDDDIKCYFYHEDIKEIGFMHELGQFYIFIVAYVTYDNKVNKKYKRKEVAGIDLGIHSPITLYNGDKMHHLDMGKQRLNKIRYLERRAKRLQATMDRKMIVNKERNLRDPSYPLYTKNYRKVQRKFRRTWKRIVDLRCDWRRKMAKCIATKYKTIIVDEFKQPTKEDHENLPGKVIRRFNHYNREHAMYLFIEALRHACEKYGCLYIEAPKNTTRTCSECGHKNPKLLLSERIFECEECDNILDRDENAAINCYEYFFELQRNH